MKKLTIVALASLLALPACVTDELGPEDIESTEAALDDEFEPGGTSCSVAATQPHLGPLINGTMDRDSNCCGVALCIDREICGERYGQYTEACLDCYFFNCLLGDAPQTGDDDEWWGGWGGALPSVYDPRGGANAP